MINVRQAQDKDIEEIKSLCFDNNRRLPSEIGNLIVAEKDGKIVGHANVCLKSFIDPLVIDEKNCGTVEKVRIIDALYNTIKGIFIANNIQQFYFTASGDDFIKFLEKKFDVEVYSKEQLFKGKI